MKLLEKEFERPKTSSMWFIINKINLHYIKHDFLFINIRVLRLCSMDCKSSLMYSTIGTFVPRGVLPYMGYIGMCGPKGYGFSAVLVINWVSIFAL